MTQASFEKVDQHWYYCRRAKTFPELKNHGSLQTSQTKTTKKTGLTTDKVLRWYGTVDETFNELNPYNCWHEDWEGIKISKKIDSFGGNVDETSMSAVDVNLLWS